MKRHILWAAPLAALTLTAAAPMAVGAAPKTASADAAKPARSCFWTRSVTSFRAPNERTLNVRVNTRDVYQFDLIGPCFDIDWTQKIALVSRGGSQICAGVDADIITPTPIGPQRCSARNMRKLTPEEVAALPRGERP